MFPALDNQMSDGPHSWERSHVHVRQWRIPRAPQTCPERNPVCDAHDSSPWPPPRCSSARRPSWCRQPTVSGPPSRPPPTTRTPGRTSGSTAAASCPVIVFNPDREEPDLRPHRHRRRLPVEPGRRRAGPRCSTGSGQDNWGYNGVLSIATDPVDTNRVYAAVGMYTNSWDPNNGAILRSTDQRRHLAGHQAAVQERRQHARPRHGRAARGRPARRQPRLLRRRGRQRPVAQHRLRRHLGQGRPRSRTPATTCRTRPTPTTT